MLFNSYPLQTTHTLTIYNSQNIEKLKE